MTRSFKSQNQLSDFGLFQLNLELKQHFIVLLMINLLMNQDIIIRIALVLNTRNVFLQIILQVKQSMMKQQKSCGISVVKWLNWKTNTTSHLLMMNDTQKTKSQSK